MSGRAALVAVTTAALLSLGGVSPRMQAVPETGAAAAWHKLRKLQTTASVLHTTAHPDDEHGGVLAMLSRGRGARVSLLTLTRGESGDNAIGPELFDQLGLIRTEELLVANRYYGVDEQYFGTVADYGFSKRLDEALEKWGRQDVLREMVRVIRIERPFVIISRFQGNERDGHGNHSAAGLLTREAFDAAADPAQFPDQVAAGLRPWQALKLYMGGVRANEDWTIRVDSGEFDPVLGDTYQSFARLGLSFQRSQNAGRVSRQPGAAVSYYKQLKPGNGAAEKEQTFFAGIDTSIPGLYRALRKRAPAGADARLADIDREVRSAIDSFTLQSPATSAPALARALAATRSAMAELSDPDIRHSLGLKEHQIADALAAVLGISVTAIAQPAGTPETSGPFAAGPPAMPPVIPGQTFEVRAVFASPAGAAVTLTGLDLEAPGKWTIGAGTPSSAAAPGQPILKKFTVTVPEDAPLTRPHIERASIQDARYSVRQEAHRHRPAPPAAVSVAARYDVGGVPVTLRRAVTRFEANLPYGYDTRELAVVPAVAVTMSPANLVAPIAPSGNGARTIRVNVEVVNNRAGESSGSLKLDMPPGWTSAPANIPLRFRNAGERSQYAFDVSLPALDTRSYQVRAVATAGGREYREGYDVLRHRDLETRYSYREAIASVRGVDVRIAPGLKVGYVMGIGDLVPAGLAQLGVEVQLLDARALATASLGQFDAVMTGTRAYAVREDLKTYNGRLLEYVRNGGNLIVLYNTQEFDPGMFAPYPAELPASAEEVSEEDSPVEILAPAAAVLNTPNRITIADFAGWVEQRGSKFWTTWDPRYTAMIATWDRNQAPQKGGWLHARYGKGHYSYFAYAFHRQLPYAVPGAYRLLANLLSLKPE